MARKLKLQHLKFDTETYEGASAYDFSDSHPLIHLAFTFGSALFFDGFYETEQKQIRRFAKALIAAHKLEPKFPWQYAAWMRDPKDGKGNRIQGSLAVALLDSMLDETEFTESYVAKTLSHRPDDVTAFLRHVEQLGLNAPSAAARRGMAQALTGFDEYQLMKYAEQKASDVRLCDVIYFVRPELQAIGTDAKLALAVGEYLHASSRDRKNRLDGLPLTRARRHLWQQPKRFKREAEFMGAVREARVTWEQLLSHFGDAGHRGSNTAIWDALLQTRGLLGDMAFLRNLRNMYLAGYSVGELQKHAKKRRFDEVWPHQVYAGYKAVPELRAAFDEVFAKSVAKLPTGRHLGIADASGSMGVQVGGEHGSLTCMDVAFCLTGLMSETSGIGASFADDSWMSYGKMSKYISVAQRQRNESALAFTSRDELRRGWGGTQVFGAVIDLIEYLERNQHIKPPDCLWFFSDMQFHPAEGAKGRLPAVLEKVATKFGFGRNVPPLELALRTYRERFGRVDVVLWNLAAYSPVPVPADMEGVLLVSGFDTNTFRHVETWRKSGKVGAGKVERNQQVVLDDIRSF